MPGLAKSFRDLRYWIFYGVIRKRGVELVTLGDEKFGLQWTICPVGLNRHSIVYSAGVGGDVTFERALVERFDCRIVMCDPSPIAAKTMARTENRLPNFRFFPVGLAGHSGTIEVTEQLDKDGETWFSRNERGDGKKTVCLDLKSLMEKNGDDRIDLLKIDIEGSEYEVIEELSQRRIPVRQLCVEFHHGILPGISRMRSVRTMVKLMMRGYRLVHQEVCNHTFMIK